MPGTIAVMSNSEVGSTLKTDECHALGVEELARQLRFDILAARQAADLDLGSACELEHTQASVRTQACSLSQDCERLRRQKQHLQQDLETKERSAAVLAQKMAASIQNMRSKLQQLRENFADLGLLELQARQASQHCQCQATDSASLLRCLEAEARCKILQEKVVQWESLNAFRIKRAEATEQKALSAEQEILSQKRLAAIQGDAETAQAAEAAAAAALAWAAAEKHAQAQAESWAREELDAARRKMRWAGLLHCLAIACPFAGAVAGVMFSL